MKIPIPVRQNSYLQASSRRSPKLPAQLPVQLQDLVANNQPEANLVRIGFGFGAITDMKVGPDNHVYVVDIFGTIYQITGPGVPVELQGFEVE